MPQSHITVMLWSVQHTWHHGGTMFAPPRWRRTTKSVQRINVKQPLGLYKENNCLQSIFLDLSQTFGYLEQKLLGRLWKSLFFLKSNFYVSENFKFQCDPFSNKKYVSQRSSCCQCGLSEMAYFIFRYFSTKFGTYVDGYEKIIIWKCHWNRPTNKRYRANIVENLYYGKCTGKRDFTQQNFLFRQNMCRNLKFLTAEKIDWFKKKQTFSWSAQ
jgi:hypothetical protein